MKREKIVKLAREWIGTPYHNQAALKGVGCDCLGLVRGLWRELYGEEPPEIPAYSPLWSGRDKQETLLIAAQEHLQERLITERLPGTVLLFRFKPGTVARHCGVLTSPETMVHAHSGRKVYEVNLGQMWEPKVTGAFVFPGTED